MIAPTPVWLLETWEQGLGCSILDRARLLLERAASGGEEEQVGQLSVGDGDWRLIELHETVFGPCFQAVCRCPRCRETMELNFEKNALRAKAAGPVSTKERRHLRAEGHDVTFRLLTLADLAAVAGESDPAAARTRLLERCVLGAATAEGPVASKELPDSIVAELSQAMQRLDPQACIHLQLRCPSCEHQWPCIFDIAAYLWSELHHWAQNLLREVHALARAYGWSEGQILALSPQRRRHYLELILA